MLAKTTAAEASQELVIQALVPFRTQESPSSRAVVEAAPASLPFPAPHTDSDQRRLRPTVTHSAGSPASCPAGVHGDPENWAPQNQGHGFWRESSRAAPAPKVLVQEGKARVHSSWASLGQRNPRAKCPSQLG